MIFADSHAHIYAKQFDNDRDQAIDTAAQAGVRHIFMPNVDAASIDRMLETELRHESCTAIMGLHPCHVLKDFERELYIVEEWLARRSWVAVGEIGLDYYWDKTFVDQQKEALRIQIEWAKRYGRPIVLHCRESMDDVIEIVEQAQDGNLRGVFHCFTGTAQQAEKVVKLGFYLGIGGVLTYKNSDLPQVLKDVPLDKLLLETDAPYLAPLPHRGKRNEPAYIPVVAQKLADVFQTGLREVAQQTTANTLALFNMD